MRLTFVEKHCDTFLLTTLHVTVRGRVVHHKFFGKKPPTFFNQNSCSGQPLLSGNTPCCLVQQHLNLPHVIVGCPSFFFTSSKSCFSHELRWALQIRSCEKSPPVIYSLHWFQLVSFACSDWFPIAVLFLFILLINSVRLVFDAFIISLFELRKDQIFASLLYSCVCACSLFLFYLMLCK